jgi:hypothetical protein
MRRCPAFDAGTHRDQQPSARSTTSGSLRRVLENGLAVGQRRRHHQVLGAGHRDHVGGDARALEALGAGHDVPVFDGDLRAHRLQPLDVLIDRTRADGAAAGQRHTGLAETRQQRAQHQDRGPHGLDQIVGRLDRIDHPTCRA